MAFLSRRRRPGPGPSWPSRSPTGSGWGCTGAPSNGPGGGDAPRVRFWPVGEAAQADYETLRAHVLEHGRLPDSLAAARFARRGLAGLIAWPSAEPVFVGRAAGRARGPPWTPHADPRLDALAAGFAFLLDAARPRDRSTRRTVEVPG